MLVLETVLAYRLRTVPLSCTGQGTHSLRVHVEGMSNLEASYIKDEKAMRWSNPIGDMALTTP
jgi:hypothetical protein